MGSKANRTRKKWQDYSGLKASSAEQDFYTVFSNLFKDSNFQIRAKPNEFSNIYVDIKLSKKVLSEIYIPHTAITRHGVFPDYAIDNFKTKKTLYIEVKRQDGWIEGGVRSDGRENAHEKSSKFFTPGLLKILRAKGNLGEDVLPFWTVFQGNITRDPCRVREITCWYDEYIAHYYFWRDSKNPIPLMKHFNKHLKRLLL
ncbi:MAG: MunI family type II restriction endonuclease [Bacteroidetes bacterium]|nr:MunI family type II restriction endonuclease [Bacteroidota bacterium]